MELSEHDKIDKLLKLAEDNNRMLHSMRRSMIWSQIFTFLYWMAILGMIGWSYYFLQPYALKYWDLYQSAMTKMESIEKTGQTFSGDIGGLLEKIQ